MYPDIILRHSVLNAFHLAWSTSWKRLGYVLSMNVHLFASIVKGETTYCDDNLTILSTTSFGTLTTYFYPLSRLVSFSPSPPSLPGIGHLLSHRGHPFVSSYPLTWKPPQLGLQVDILIVQQVNDHVMKFRNDL